MPNWATVLSALAEPECSVQLMLKSAKGNGSEPWILLLS